MSDSEAELTLVMKARNLASREVDRLHRSLGRARGGAANLGGALVTLAKVGVAGLAIGIGAVVVGLIGATKAAADEQKGVARLNAALKANVKGFNGNTAAIEALITKREGLAFSDDSLRASLTILVGKYKDVDRAQRLQATAMDLARLKGISLEDATAMLSKGLDGSAKVLKVLGIELPKTATEQERLTAIQKVAAGQAEAYGKTAAGAQEAFGIALADVVEDIGSGLLPVMTTAFTWLREHAIPAVRDIIGRIQAWMTANRPLIDQVRNVLVKVLGFVVDKITAIVTWIGNLVGSIARNKDAMNVLRTVAQGIADAASAGWKAISLVVTWIANAVAAITKNKTVMRVFATTFDIIAGAVRGVVGAIKDVIKFGQDAIAVLAQLSGTKPGKIGHYDTNSNGKGYAAGGWAGLNGPELSWLGERGPEYVIPNHRLGRAGTAAGGGGTVVINAVWPPTAAQLREIMATLEREMGYRLAAAPPTRGR